MEKRVKPGQPEAISEAIPIKKNEKKKEKKDSIIKRFLTTLILLGLIILLTSIIFFGAVFIFNIGGKALKSEVAGLLTKYPIIGPIMKPIAMDMTPKQLSAYEKEQAILKEKQYEADLKKREADLVTKANEITLKEAALAKRESSVFVMENDVKTLKEALNGSLNSVKEQALYFEKMDATKAMNILVNMDSKETIIPILRSMQLSKAIAIISLMDPLQGAQIMQEIAPVPSPTPIKNP